MVVRARGRAGVRNISFALTTAQIRAHTKTVTRRRGTWWATVLKPGDLLCAVEKSQGIKKGGLVRLGVIRVVFAQTERLGAMGPNSNLHGWLETEKEGFQYTPPEDFIAMFCKHMGGDEDQLVTRIEFEYVDA